jgi:hypothetical protein
MIDSTFSAPKRAVIIGSGFGGPAPGGGPTSWWTRGMSSTWALPW